MGAKKAAASTRRSGTQKAVADARSSDAGAARAPASEVSPARARASAGHARAPVDLGRALVEAFATNERVNQLLLERLDPAAWNAPPPGTGSKGGRTIAAIVAHVHNVR